MRKLTAAVLSLIMLISACCIPAIAEETENAAAALTETAEAAASAPEEASWLSLLENGIQMANTALDSMDRTQSAVQGFSWSDPNEFSLDSLRTHVLNLRETLQNSTREDWRQYIALAIAAGAFIYRLVKSILPGEDAAQSAQTEPEIAAAETQPRQPEAQTEQSGSSRLVGLAVGAYQLVKRLSERNAAQDSSTPEAAPAMEEAGQSAEGDSYSVSVYDVAQILGNMLEYFAEQKPEDK